jgi:hypothetical protein
MEFAWIVGLGDGHSDGLCPSSVTRGWGLSANRLAAIGLLGKIAGRFLGPSKPPPPFGHLPRFAGEDRVAFR